MILAKKNEINGVLGNDPAQWGYTGPGTTYANEMDFDMNHAPGAESIAWHVALRFIIN